MAVNLSPVGGVAAQFFTNTGAVLTGGKLYTYLAGTTTPTVTYTTSAASTPWSNPIVLDSAGRVSGSGEIWLTVGVNYKFILRDSNDVLIGTYDNVPGQFNTDASLVTYTPAGTGAVTTTVQAKLRQYVSVMDFGAVGNGTTDDTAAIQAAINAVVAGGAGDGGSVLFPDTTASYRITSSISLPSYVTLTGEGRGTAIKKDFQNGFAFSCISKIYITIENLSVFSTVAATTSPSGAIGFQSCSYCVVNNVSIFDREQYGVWLYDSNYCQVTNCNTSGAFAFAGDNYDIAVLNNSNYNVVANNVCTGGANNGSAIAVTDPYSSSQPTGNKIVGNQVANYTTYGILVYVTNTYNSKTIVDGNTVDTIYGSGLSGVSGTGIYIQSAGGTVVTNNAVSNCCISTSNFFTLAPGCIGITLPSSAFPVLVANNILQSIRGPCVAAITNGGPVTISGNTCRLVGTDAATNLVSIYASNSPRCNIANNVIEHTSPSPAIQVLARSAATVVDTSITNNSVTASQYGIYVSRLDTSTFESLRMIGNYVAGPTLQSIQIAYVDGSSISGNMIYGSATVFELNNSVRSRMEGNSFSSTNTSTPVIFFVGTNTNSIFSETNTIVGRVENASASGVIVSQYGNTAPVGGTTWNVGDRVIQSVPVVGQPKGWRCTVAGAPGTWVSEGNL